MKRSRRRTAILALAAWVGCAAPTVSTRSAHAALGDCSQPLSGGSAPVATDCLYILNVAIGLQSCAPACICAPSGALPTVAGDALACLLVATGGTVVLDCPCGVTTTLTPPTSTTVPPATTSTLASPSSSTTTTTLAVGTGCPDTLEITRFAGVGGTCNGNDDCPVGTCNPVLSRCTTVTELDLGWKGIGHDGDTNHDEGMLARLSCGETAPCGVCEIDGIVAGSRACRCANDNRTICDEPFSVDEDDCGGATCTCYLGAPLPLSSASVPSCIVTQLASDPTGTIDVDSGELAFTLDLRAKHYLGIDAYTPCPFCGRGCTAPAYNLGVACSANADCDSSACSLNASPCQTNDDCAPHEGVCEGAGNGVCGSADVTAGDGVRDGTCVGQGSVNAGEPCDVDAENTTFPWTTTSIGGGSSLDCFPASGLNVSGDGLQINLGLTTGSQQRTSNVPCGLLPFVPETCTCGECSLNTAIPCSSDADCSAASAGTCRTVGQGGRPDNCAGDGICNDAGGGEGVCAQGPNQGFCDGSLRSNGEPFVMCGSNADCAVFDGAGLCTLSRTLECFRPTIEAAGSPDPETPVGAAIVCVPSTNSRSYDSVFGLPGPARLVSQMRTRKLCGGPGGTVYIAGSGCAAPAATPSDVPAAD